jgi:hypothetical protein
MGHLEPAATKALVAFQAIFSQKIKIKIGLHNILLPSG